MRRFRVIGWLAVLALVIAACGGGSEGSTTTAAQLTTTTAGQTTTTAEPSGTTTPPSDNPLEEYGESLDADPALVEKALGPVEPSDDLETWGNLLRVTAPGAHTTIAAGTDEPGRVPEGEIIRQWEMARAAGLRIHAPAGSGDGAEGAVGSLAAAGALGEDVTLIHCTSLSDPEYDAIASAGVSVVLAPSEEMAGGFGMPPVQKLMDRQIRPGLGVGRESVAPGDVFAQMRAVISVQHASYFDLKLAGKAGLPNLLNTRETIKFGTSHGAAAVGLGESTGSLEPGKAADLIVLRTDRPNIWPINDPIGAVVWGMDTSNLDWVFVGGRPVVRQGSLTAGAPDVRRLATEAQQQVAGRAGLLETTGDAP